MGRVKSNWALDGIDRKNVRPTNGQHTASEMDIRATLFILVHPLVWSKKVAVVMNCCPIRGETFPILVVALARPDSIRGALSSPEYPIILSPSTPVAIPISCDTGTKVC